MLQKRFIIKPGLETEAPEQALSQYLKVFNEHGISIEGKRCLLFGYGGNFALGCLLLAQRAKHVVLLDKYAYPDIRRNQTLLLHYPQYLQKIGNTVSLNPQYLTCHHADIQDLSLAAPIDMILSSSVLEHVDQVDETIQALSRLTAPQGIHVHFIDLRDHYFKYPFEMLCYSQTTWERWLQPSSHLNRYRMQDYQNIFTTYFTQVDMTLLTQDIEQFRAVQPRIQKHFLTGEDEIDSATQILVVAQNVRHS
ncbi:MAG: methyltransferase domain-containing protein [Pseudomonadota bacterium]|nr:methyltransferase domain-containing protein [Pseudomonadota bacterium]